MFVAVAVEEVEDEGGYVGEEVHEDGGPEDPGEVSSVLFYQHVRQQGVNI